MCVCVCVSVKRGGVHLYANPWEILGTNKGLYLVLAPGHSSGRTGGQGQRFFVVSIVVSLNLLLSMWTPENYTHV